MVWLEFEVCGRVVEFLVHVYDGLGLPVATHNNVNVVPSFISTGDFRVLNWIDGGTVKETPQSTLQSHVRGS